MYFAWYKYFKNASPIKLFIVGSICYIILHALIFAENLGSKYDGINKYKNYLYYLFFMDAILTVSYIKLFCSKQTAASSNIVEPVAKQVSEQNNISEIKDRLSKLKERQNNSSPFAKKKRESDDVQDESKGQGGDKDKGGDRDKNKDKNKENTGDKDKNTGDKDKNTGDKDDSGNATRDTNDKKPEIDTEIPVYSCAPGTQ